MPPISTPSPVLPLLARIATGEVSSFAAFERYADAIATREPAIGAFAHLDVAAARASLPVQAKRGLLAGLPVGIKDIFDTADMPTAYGTALYAGHRPAADAAIVALARRAGAAIVGKTVTTPFANLDPTPCQNPRAPGHTPGGSSSGSAAAVAAGMIPFAIGTQTGGSVVRPASYCGIAGFKPSFRLLPATGMKTFSWNLDTAGLFAPMVADVALFAAALSGRPLRIDAVHVSAPRLGLLAVPDPALAEPPMLAALDRATEIAERAGATLVDLGADPALQAAWDVHATIQNYEGARAMAYEVDRFGNQIPPLVRADLVAGSVISHEDYDTARGIVSKARKAAGRLFERVDAILTPAAPGAPPLGLSSTGRALFNRLWTLTGDPAVAVPGLMDDAGLPLGMQIIAPFGEDHKALAIAHWLEGLLAKE
jgi:Asp-tRNA(Asn)/Glu-tRNA(Gln) amidotransferase A subunit family amidase